MGYARRQAAPEPGGDPERAGIARRPSDAFDGHAGRRLLGDRPGSSCRRAPSRASSAGSRPFAPRPSTTGRQIRAGFRRRSFPSISCARAVDASRRMTSFQFDERSSEHLCNAPGCPGGGRAVAYPARFMVACSRGHLDDFPWHEYVHPGVPATPSSGWRTPAARAPSLTSGSSAPHTTRRRTSARPSVAAGRKPSRLLRCAALARRPRARRSAVRSRASCCGAPPMRTSLPSNLR